MGYIRKTIEIIDAVPISDGDRHKIYKGNGRRLLKFCDEAPRSKVLQRAHAGRPNRRIPPSHVSLVIASRDGYYSSYSRHLLQKEEHTWQRTSIFFGPNLRPQTYPEICRYRRHPINELIRENTLISRVAAFTPYNAKP